MFTVNFTIVFPTTPFFWGVLTWVLIENDEFHYSVNALETKEHRSSLSLNCVENCVYFYLFINSVVRISYWFCMIMQSGIWETVQSTCILIKVREMNDISNIIVQLIKFLLTQKSLHSTKKNAVQNFCMYCFLFCWHIWCYRDAYSRCNQITILSFYLAPKIKIVNGLAWLRCYLGK